jgi:rRNA small subunit pseudouridine methyltransferase Nep1
LVKQVYIAIVESALETVPHEITFHNAILNDARRRQVNPDELLLDRSLHHAAMRKLPNQEKRGRPDIVYHILLDAANTPIFKAGLLNIVFHTYNDLVIWVKSGLRPPRSYFRYEQLMMQLFRDGKVGNDLLVLEKSNFRGLKKRVNPDIVIGFSKLSEYRSLNEIVVESRKFDLPMFVIGGFPKGHFDESVVSNINKMYSVSQFSLDASLVVNRLLCVLENDDQIKLKIEKMHEMNIK